MTSSSSLRKPRLYFAGLGQHQHCEWLKGRPVLESFANTRKLMLPYRATFDSMALEGGVIANLNAKKRGKSAVVAFRPYLQFAQEHGEFYDWVASFDVIDGGPRVNRRYWQLMKDAQIPRLMPVFHQHEPWSLLDEYCAGSAFVGLGFQRPASQQERWLDECFSRIPSRLHVHGFAMTSFLLYPFASVDSTTWIHDLLDLVKVGGQAGSVLECLTRRELMELVKAKYERLPLLQRWRGLGLSGTQEHDEREPEEIMAELNKRVAERFPLQASTPQADCTPGLPMARRPG